MIKIGIIDSGFSCPSGYGASFYKDGKTVYDETEHRYTHGSVIASLIESEGVELYSAKVFHERLITSAGQVARALDYLRECEVDIIHMSLGMRNDYPMVRARCEAYLCNGGIIIASTPTQGSAAVFPAAYPGVIRVCADGRCRDAHIRLLEHDPIRFGASPLSDDTEVRGSSVAAARVSAVVGSLLSRGIPTSSLTAALITYAKEFT